MLLQSLLPIGEENDFKGVVDLVETKLLFGMKKVGNLRDCTYS
jgi:hypothetical protein